MLKFENKIFDSKETSKNTIIKSKEELWSQAGSCFLNASNASLYSRSLGTITAGETGAIFFCPVNLPEGATITSCVVYGNVTDTNETWTLRLVDINGASGTPGGIVSSSKINTMNKSMQWPIVDNKYYAYFLITSALTLNDEIFGARITYKEK